MTRRWDAWRRGALLTLLCVVSAGCRPLVSTPPGCEEGTETCEPAPPASAAEVRLTAPARLLESGDDPPIFGRFLPVELEITRSQGADEVELLCGDRRLATWWLSPSEDAPLGLSALVDLLSCRPPGTSDHPLPVTLSLVSGDALGARQDHGQFALLADFTFEEGEQPAPGDPAAPATARIELTEEPSTEDGRPALVRVEGLLGEAPEVRIDGVPTEVWPVRDGWRFFVPSPDFSNIDTFEIDVDVQVQLQTTFGVPSLVTTRLTLERAQRTVHLDGDLFAPGIPKPAAFPVMGPEGLVLVMEDTAASVPGTSARLVRVPAAPSAPLEALTFPIDPGGSPEGCSSPDDPVASTTSCILGLHGTGQLVVRRTQPAPLEFELSVLSADAWDRWTPDATLESLLQPPVVDPAPYSPPVAWGRLGADRLCTEARATSCVGAPCGPFNRACVVASGAVESTPPESPPQVSWDAGGSSRARGGGPYFATYDHTFSLNGNLPLLTLGTQDGGQVALGIGAPTSIWTYQRGLTALVPVRDGFALVSHGGHNAFYPGADAQVEQLHATGWMNRYWFYAIVHVEPNGALLVVGEYADGTQELSRWAPGSAEPQNVQPIPPHPDGFEGSPQPSLDLVEDGYSQTFADGSAALVYRVGYSGLPYRLLVVDGGLRPLLRRRSPRPMRAMPGPDGDTLWLIESVSASPGDGNQILVLPR